MTGFRSLGAAGAIASVLVLATAQTSEASSPPFPLYGGHGVGSLPSASSTTHCTVQDPRDTTIAVGCFVEHGDHIYVRDKRVDGRAAMVFFNTGVQEGACLNAGGYHTVAVCDLAVEIPENTQICITAGNIELGAGPNQWHFTLSVHSQTCFTNDH